MAIMCDMSVKEFWEDSPDLFWAYRFSYLTKLKMEQERFNRNAWLQGAYICEAVQVAINNSFSKQKIEYSKSPYGVEYDEEIEYKEMQQKLVSQITKRVSELQALKGVNSSTTKDGNTNGGDKDG